jgi:copper oxidase (laccase) domain-containing protein
MIFQQFFSGIKNNSIDDAIKKKFIKNNVVIMQQVHGNKITNLDLLDLSTSNDIIKIDNVDACFTTKKNLLLCVKSADCLPILISGFGTKKESRNQAIPFVAAAHAGRKGTQLNILFNLLEKINTELDIVKTLANNQLNIWFGPAICVDCYQIDRAQDIHYNLIEENKKQIIKFLKNHQIENHKNLNLVVKNNCTLHEPEKYHSYRKTGKGVKMNYSFIKISN